MAKSFEQILNDIITRVNQTIGEVDTRVGTVTRDAILAPVSSELSTVYTEVETGFGNISVQTVDLTDNAAVDRLAQNYGISRRAGARSTGNVRFYTSNLAPTEAIEIPVFTQVSTNSTPIVTFKTLATKILNTATYDTSLQAYYVDVPVLCDLSGASGNVAAGTIVLEDMRGIDGVTNPQDFTNGSDEQSNEDLVETIKATARGNVGTQYGYESLIRNNFVVGDVKVITPDSADTIGGWDAGYSDVIIQTASEIVAEDMVPFISSSETTEIIPILKPMTSVYEISGTGATAGIETPVVLAEGLTGDYELVVDKGSVYAYGTSSLSKVILHPRPEINLKPNSILSFKYYYQDLINSIDLFLKQPENKIVGSSVLVKSGVPVPVLITAGIKVVPGYTQSDVISRATLAIQSFLDSFLLGQAVQSSDVVSVISSTEGVDSVNIATFKMSIASEPTTYVSALNPSTRQYLIYGSATIQVEV